MCNKFEGMTDFEIITESIQACNRAIEACERGQEILDDFNIDFDRFQTQIVQTVADAFEEYEEPEISFREWVKTVFKGR